MEIAYSQVLLLLLQCLIVAILLASLFRLRSIFGLGLLYISLGVFQFLQVFLANALLIEIATGIFISTGSMVLFSSSLFMVLLIYIREDALETRKIIYALLAANLVASLMLVIFGWSIDNEIVANVYNLPLEFFTINARILVVGTAIFILDAFALIVIYEFISKYLKSLFLRILFTTTLVLSLDAILFSFGIFFGELEFQTIIISAVISKILAAITYSSLFTLYLQYFDTKTLKSESEVDTYKDVFHKLTFRQKYDDVFTEMKNKSFELQEAQKIAQLGTYNLDLTTMLFISSPIFDNIFGFNFEKTKKYTTYQKIVHPDDLPENQKMLQKCFKTGQKFDREFRIINKNTKKLKWIHGMGKIIYTEGKPTFFKGTVQDITARKIVELKVKMNERKLKEVQKIAKLGTYEIDLETNYIETSDVYNSILGLKEKPKNNKGWWKSITHPEDYERSELLWQQCIKDCTIYEDKYRIFTDKNEIKWIHDIAEIKCNNGIAVKIIGTIQDISNLKLFETKIKRSDVILSQINSLVKVTDENGSLTYASPSFKTVLGYEPNEMLGQGWWIKTTDNIKLANQLRDEVLDVVQNNKILNNKLSNRWIKTKDGKPKLFQWTCSKGLGNSLIFIGIDVTERKIAEKNSSQYWKIVENSLNEIFIYDAETLQFIEVNRGARKNIGYSLTELLKMTPVDITPQLSKSKIIKLLEPLKNNTQEKIILNTDHQRKDGTTYKAEVDIQKSELKLKPVFIASVKDVTQQQRNEQIKQIIFNITKKSNESINLEKLFNFIKTELGKLINTTNFFVALYDEKTEMIHTPYMVDELEIINDFPKGETLTGHIIDTKKSILTKDPIFKESPDNHKEIGYGPASKSWLGVPILIDNQAIGAIVVQSYTDENAYNEDDVILLELVASNIGQIIRKSEDLKKIKLLNQALINTPAIVMITNKKVELEFINASFTSSLGYEFNEVIGKNPKFLNPNIKLKEFYTEVANSITAKGYWKNEINNIRKNGDLIRMSTSIAPVKDEDGNLSHYIIIEEDITEQRKLERQFISAIIAAQDIEKQSFGEELHDSISQILSAESMYIDLLIEQNQDLNKDKIKFLTKIKELNSSAIEETRNIAHGLMSNQLKQNGLLMSVENICIDFSNKKNIEFKFINDDVDENDLSEEIKTNLFRIIQELSTNISRYSNATKASIHFSKLNKNNLKLVVEDNGIGMDYNKVINESAGIGLQTVKRRVTFLNGFFELESVLNKGTCFTLKIPL